MATERDIVDRLRLGPDAAEVLEAAAEIEWLRQRLAGAQRTIAAAGGMQERLWRQADDCVRRYLGSVDDGPRHPGDEFIPGGE